ncbi:hypothetical protein F5884DRAFT_273399 [Xylogone sp. PMI_703]|nr:hypothetical protein F5884DRAFT_273399 [Xylogone sp. PMI_703]
MLESLPTAQAKERARGKGPRLYHKKSRTGCQRCKARRVKCDETRPVCSSCQRHDVECVYPQPSETAPRGRAKAGQPAWPDSAERLQSSDVNSSPDTRSPERMDMDGDNDLVIPESKSRRELELRLLHNYIHYMAITISNSHFPIVKDTWAIEVPKLAFRYEALQYAIFSISSLHLLHEEPDSVELKDAHRDYTSLALRKHREAVSNMTSDNSDNADANGFTSILILMTFYAYLQERVIEPYTPPLSWLHISNATGNVFKSAWQTIQQSKSSKLMDVLGASPVLMEKESIFSDEYRTEFQEILQNVPPFEEPYDRESWAAYEKTFSFIGSVKRAIKGRENPMATCSRLITFAIIVPEKFIKLVEDQRPRALVILAHYFALCNYMRHIWWIGDIGKREVLGIQKALPPQWQRFIAGPVSIIEKSIM